MNLKCICWNVKGLNDQEKRKMVNLLLKGQNANIIYLMETKIIKMIYLASCKLEVQDDQH